MMDLMTAMKERRSVRSFTDRRIDEATAAALQAEIEACNREGGVHLQLCLDEPQAFAGRLASYGMFRNVRNYLVVVGPAGEAGDVLCGYYGERIVLRAQQLGLNSCWVGLTYSKGKVGGVVADGEKRRCVIALGYGDDEGRPHRNKPLAKLCRVDGEMPEWFRRGMEAALLAPTAMNQQKFVISLEGDRVSAQALSGFYARVDLGIVRYHFELGAAGGEWSWQE